MNPGLVVREGVYSASIALNILDQSTSRTLPINWSVPYVVDVASGCTPTTSALALAPSGAVVVAGFSCGATSYVWQSNFANALSSWSQIATPAGASLRLAVNPLAYVLATTIESNGSLLATTIPEGGGPLETHTFMPVVDDSPVVVPNAFGSEEGIVATTPSNGIMFYSSMNNGQAFTTISIGPTPDSNISAILNSAGSTRLATPGGKVGQVSATVVGGQLFALYTDLQAGTVRGAVVTSSDGGAVWQPPVPIELPVGGMLDPVVLGTQAGYVLGTWLATGGGNLSVVEETTFGPDGRMISPPMPVPGGTGVWPVSERAPVAIAADSFQRPLLAWPTPVTSPTSGNTVEETGGYLSPNNLAALESEALWNLTNSDFTSSTSSTATSFAAAMSAALKTAVSGLASPPSTSALDAARNQTSQVYQNVSVTSLSFVNETVKVVNGKTEYLAPGGANLAPAVLTAPLAPPTDPAIVPSQGFDSAVTYLCDETDWLWQAEGIQPLASDNPLVNATLLDGVPTAVSPASKAYASATVDGLTSSTPVIVTVTNPTTADAYFPGSFASYAKAVDTGTFSCYGTSIPEWINHTSDIPTSFQDTVTLDGGTLPVVTNSSWIPTIYFQNLSADTQIPWTVTLKATYTASWQQTLAKEIHGTTECEYTDTASGSGDPYGPGSVSMAAGSNLTTSLATETSADEIGNEELQVNWTNSMFADGESVLNPGNLARGPSGFTNSSPLYDYTDLTVNQAYVDTVNTSSHPGSWSFERYSVSEGVQTSSPVQSVTSDCVFTYVTNTVTVTGLTVTNGANDTAAISWYGNGTTANGLGTLDYYEIGTALNLTVEAAVTASGTSGTSWKYVAELHGLYGGAFYELIATVTEPSGAGGCLSLSNSAQQLAILGQGFPLSAQAYPYDSISETGGGEGIYASLPSSLLAQQGRLVNYTGGEIVYGPASDRGPNITIPIPSLTAISCGSDCVLENLTPSQPNTTYDVQEIWNFSWGKQNVSIRSAPFTFEYLLDSSGDGLTDQEKLNGWDVTYTDVSGTVHNEVVTAEPSKYATNGLIGDYVEKKLGLSPYTLDTASSGMLDTWNLTFDLRGVQGEELLALAFNIWNESGLYNPFATNVSYSPGLYEKGSPVGSLDLSNLTPSPTGGIYSGDGSPWAAEALWSSQALDTLYFLWSQRGVDTLRAVEGEWDGIPTLTVWGKLSWGANPLVASAAQDGIADGSRINPSAPVGLSITVSHLYVTHLKTGEGYATQFQLYSGSTATGMPELTNYSAPVGLSGGTSLLTGYTVVLPISQTSQFETLQIEVLVNESGSSTLTAVPFDGILKQVDVTYDMVHGALVSESWSNTTGNPNGTLALSISTVPLDRKSPTYLWLPDDNSTVNGLPLGLERYTGEQSFDLVVVNASASLTSVSIPYPWGGSYTISLQPGLNNLLFPREQFLNSSFATAVYEGKNFPYPSNHPTPPILSSDSTAQSLLTQSFGSGSGLMFDLEAYWQNRSIASGPANFTTAETGVSSSSSLQVRTMVVETAPANNTGGLASDPSVYISIPSPPALQAILTLNITSTATLDLLLSALLTNTTAGVNGTFQTATNQVASLGLAGPVLSALANAPVISQGLYGPPTYNKAPPLAGGIWGDFWNAVSAVVTTITGAIDSIVGEVYSVAVAAATYLNRIAHEGLAIGGSVLARVTGTLVGVGNLIVTALNVLGAFILSLVKDALAVVIKPIVNAAKSFDSNLAAAANATVGDIEGPGSVTTAHGIAWANSFDSIAILGDAVGAAIVVAMTLLLPLDFGASSLVPILLSLLPIFALGAIAGFGGLSSFTSQAVLNLESTFPAISKSVWEATAGAVAIAASSSSLIGANILLALKGAVGGLAAFVLLTAFIIDLIVLAITIVNWAQHLAVLASIALVFAGVGFFVASVAWAKGVDELEDYADVALLLSLVGLGAAGADYALER